MFGISLPELLIVFTVLLLLFGPDKLPELARKWGRWSGELRKMSDGLRREFYNSVYTPADLLHNRIQSEISELRSAPNSGATSPNEASTSTAENASAESPLGKEPTEQKNSPDAADKK